MPAMFDPTNALSRPRLRIWAAVAAVVLVVVIAGAGLIRLAGAGEDGMSADLAAVLDSLGTPAEEQGAVAARFKPGVARLESGSAVPPGIAGYGVTPVRFEAADLPELRNPAAGHHYALIVELDDDPASGIEIAVAATDVFELPEGTAPESDALALVDGTEEFRLDLDGGDVAAEVSGAPTPTDAFGLHRGRAVALVIPEGEANSVYVWVQVKERTGGYRLFGPHPLP